MGDIQYHIRNRDEVNGSEIELYFSAFDPADVQHIVDKRQQMLGAFADLFQTDLHFRRDHHLESDIGKANDGVHRRADIVGHIVQEDCFGSVCPFLLCQRVLQNTLIFLCGANRVVNDGKARISRSSFFIMGNALSHKKHLSFRFKVNHICFVLSTQKVFLCAGTKRKPSEGRGLFAIQEQKKRPMNQFVHRSLLIADCS